MNLENLKLPFSSDEIEWRIAQSGKNGSIWAYCLAYISARAILDRLDSVCGPENWKVSYEFISTTGVICNLSILCGTPPKDAVGFDHLQWVTKSDGAEMTDIEAFKGGISSALKRAGSAWGIGRYLYGLESGKCQIVEKDVAAARYGKTKEGTVFYWLPPQLPHWALPTTTNKNAHLSVPPLDSLPVQAIQAAGVSTQQLSDAQVRRLWTLVRVKSVPKLMVHAKLAEMGVTSEYDLTRAQYNFLCDNWIPDQSQNRVPGPVVAPKTGQLGMISNMVTKDESNDYPPMEEPPDWVND